MAARRVPALPPRTDLPPIAKMIPDKPPENFPKADPAKPDETDFQLQEAVALAQGDGAAKERFGAVGRCDGAGQTESGRATRRLAETGGILAVGSLADGILRGRPGDSWAARGG